MRTKTQQDGLTEITRSRTYTHKQLDMIPKEKIRFLTDEAPDLLERMVHAGLATITTEKHTDQSKTFTLTLTAAPPQNTPPKTIYQLNATRTMHRHGTTTTTTTTIGMYETLTDALAVAAYHNQTDDKNPKNWHQAGPHPEHLTRTTTENHDILTLTITPYTLGGGKAQPNPQGNP